jgi:hypothetical protein
MFSSLRIGEVVTAQAVKRYRLTRGLILQSRKSCQEGVFEQLKWREKGFCFNKNRLISGTLPIGELSGLSRIMVRRFRTVYAPDGDTAN